jgi:hypothetical protein
MSEKYIDRHLITRLATALNKLKPISKEDLTTVRKIISQQIKIDLYKFTSEWIRLDGAKSIERQQVNYDQIRNDYLSFTIIVKLDTGTIILLTFVVDDKLKMAMSDYIVKIRETNVIKNEYPKKVPANINFTKSLVTTTFEHISEILNKDKK